MIQFLNVAGWVASYNVRRWEMQPSRTLDLSYLGQLGPGAWPALGRVAQNERNVALSNEASLMLEEIRSEQRRRLETSDWRTWQARRDNAAQKLLSPSTPL